MTTRSYGNEVSRAARLLDIIRKLRDRPYSVGELAATMNVSNRTVQRDLLALQGEPLYIPMTQNGVAWTIPRGWRF